MRKQSVTICDELYCVNCGNKGIPIMRKTKRERPSGHLKRLWCPYCKKEFNHVQCNEFTHYTHQDFLFEKMYDNFDEDGNRKMSYGDLRKEVDHGRIARLESLEE